jgi:hypothetical protein
MHMKRDQISVIVDRLKEGLMNNLVSIDKL